MRGQRKGIALCALAAVLGMSGAAQAATTLKPKLAPAKVEPLTKEKFAELRQALGACIVSKNQSAVKKYLAHSDSMTIDYTGMGVDPKFAMFMFKLDACKDYNVPQMAQPIFMTPGALRNLLLEATYLEKAQAKPAPLMDAGGKPSPSPARSFASKEDKLASATAFATIADCTATNGLDLADALIRTGAGLPEERQAAVALAPVIGACVPEGQNVSLTPSTIRIIAAEGLWQRYASASTAQASAK